MDLDRETAAADRWAMLPVQIRSADLVGTDAPSVAIPMSKISKPGRIGKAGPQLDPPQAGIKRSSVPDASAKMR